MFTGLAAAAAFRMQLYNIGGEGQFYLGAVAALGAGLYLGDLGVGSTVVGIAVMCLAGAIAGGLWAAIPGVLRAFARTNEIITSLMLNYVAALVLTYLIIGSHSYWRDTESFEGQTFPPAVPAADAEWPSDHRIRAGRPGRAARLLLALALAIVMWVVYWRTVQLRAAGDRRLPRAAVRGHAAASQDPRRRNHLSAQSPASAAPARRRLRPRARPDRAAELVLRVRASSSRPTRYNPLAVVPVAVLIGGLQNAGYAQGADFPSGLVGVMQGLILFSVLGGELLVTTAFASADAFGGRRADRRTGGDEVSIVLAAAVNGAFLVVILASAVLYGTPLVFAALGELLAERSGVLNLGVEGMMLVGAVMGFWAVQRLNVSAASRWREQSASPLWPGPRWR